MNLLSLLTDTPRLIYDYATVVEENEQEGEVPSLTSQNKQGELMPMLDSTMYNKVCRVYWTLLLILNTNTIVSYALYATSLQATCILMMQ